MKEILQFIRRLRNRFIGHEITARSAQITYYWLLSFFPLLLLVMSILSYTSIAQADFIPYVAKFTPEPLLPFIQSTIEQVVEYRSTTILSFGAIASLWSASAGVDAIIKGIYIAYNAVDIRNFFVKRLVSIFYTMILVVLIVAMIVLLVFGENIGRYLLSLFVYNEVLYKPALEILRLSLPMVSLLLGIYAMYSFLPRKHLKYKNVWPGTLFSSVGWYVFSYLFSVYIQHFAKYNQMYGSIGGVFILLIWLYVIGMLLLMGAEVNALYQDMKKIKEKRFNKF